MTGFAWHRVFHPLCGADPLTLLRLVARSGPPSPRGALPLAVAVASSLARLPFTLAEAAWTAVEPEAPVNPVFIVGFPRSGTTHLHNLMAASRQFATVPPVLAGLPWEARGLGAVLRPLINPYLPRTRLIDAVSLAPDSPTEDEVALANMCGLSYFHAVYFPRSFQRDFLRGFLFDGAGPDLVAVRARALARYVGSMSRRDRLQRPLLLKNPAYTAQVGWLRRLYPEARIIHIHRDPKAVFASNDRALRIALRELSLQSAARAEVPETILSTYPQVMDRLLAESAGLPAHQFAHVEFEALVAEPMETLRNLWARLALPRAEVAFPQIACYLETVASYRVSAPSLAEADRAAVETRWTRHLNRFGSDALPVAG